MKKFIITFGFNQVDKEGNKLDNCYTIIHARNKVEARDIAYEKFGQTWSMLYTSEASAGVHQFNLKYLKEVNL